MGQRIFKKVNFFNGNGDLNQIFHLYIIGNIVFLMKIFFFKFILWFIALNFFYGLKQKKLTRKLSLNIFMNIWGCPR